METRLEIRLDSRDAANPKRLREAYNLVGGPSPSERTRANENRRNHQEHDYEHFTFEEVKLFSRIEGNVFTLDEAKRAVAVIKRRRDELHRDADTLEVFIDPKMQKTWGDGLKANADLAVRLAEDFLADLHDDLREMHEGKMA